MVYAGIDESGYGPLLGPLVVVRSVFSVEAPGTGDAPPCLWRALAGALCRRIRETARPDAGRRVAVNDSKLLYCPSSGLRHLERGVLALLPATAHLPPHLTGLLESLAADEESVSSVQPWYQENSGAPLLPVHVPAAEIAEAHGVFLREAARAGVRLDELRAAVIFEDRFNRLVGQTGSKASCAWRFVADHLVSIWERFGRQIPYVAIDRQGGRKAYGPLLAGLFSRAAIEVLEETPSVSRYRLSGEGRGMLVEIRVDSEVEHLPVAYASMTAKYLRELLMMRFNRYWRRIAPEVRPTAGYFVDGSRFLREIEPYLARLAIRRELLARCR